MVGSLFREHLAEYSHWSYTDPDIIWGNLSEWIAIEDLDRFDIITISKNLDASRLYIRGQFALHKNIAEINEIWKRLHYSDYKSFTQRMGSALHMLKKRVPADKIFSDNLMSAEGFYSQMVFAPVPVSHRNTSVKIMSGAFDGFSREPVMVYKGRISRCNVENFLTDCISDIVNGSSVGMSNHHFEKDDLQEGDAEGEGKEGEASVQGV